MTIRAYEPGDDALAIKLWNDSLPMDQIDNENFYTRIIYDVNFDREKYLLAFDGNEPAGFLYCTKRLVHDEIGGLEPDKAWIVAMGVRPDFRRRGVGKALLETAEHKLAAAGVTQIVVGAYATNYFCPGVDQASYAGGSAFFESLGYAIGGECCSMDINLHGYAYPEKYIERRCQLEARGYTFKQYQDADAVPLLEFMRESFPHWQPNARSCAL